MSLICSSSLVAAGPYDEAIKQFVLSKPQGDTAYYFGVTNEKRENFFEQSGISVISYGARNDRSAVGVHGYGFCSVTNPWGCWGANFEVTGAPDANVHLHGVEIGVYGRNGTCSWCAKYGIYLVFRNSADPNKTETEGNYNNNRTSAIRLGATGGRPGNYSGFQSIISLDSTALDRTVDKPYTSAIDISESTINVPFYLVVFKCKVADWFGNLRDSKCGLKVDSRNALVVDEDIDSFRPVFNP